MPQTKSGHDLEKKRSCEANRRKWKNRKNNERRLAGMHILCITTGVRLLLNAVTLTYHRDYTFPRTEHVNRTVSAIMVWKFLIAYVHAYRQNILLDWWSVSLKNFTVFDRRWRYIFSVYYMIIMLIFFHLHTHLNFPTKDIFRNLRRWVR